MVNFLLQLNLTYKWAFNNTLENINDLPAIDSQSKDVSNLDEDPYAEPVYSNVIYQQNHQKFGSIKHTRYSEKSQQLQQNAGNNIYPYKVESFQHFGTITCTAQNAIGSSGPCLYHIMAAEIPDPVRNCSATNATANSLHILCVPGRDGGIQQYFHIEIYDEENQIILYNTSFKSSDFILKRLPSDSSFRIKITAYNLQGSSSPFRLRGKTLPAPLLRTGKNKNIYY